MKNRSLRQRFSWPFVSTKSHRGKAKSYRRLPSMMQLESRVLLATLADDIQADQSSGGAEVSSVVVGDSTVGVVYEVGLPGSAYQSLADVDWNQLSAGDTVNIHWRQQPYQERLLLNAQGTENNRITIQGVAGPDGQLPVLDASGATTSTQFSHFNLQYRQNLGGSVFIGTPNSYPTADQIPEYITIRGLEIRGAGQGNSFTDTVGNHHSYAGSAGIYVKGGKHIVVENCFIHHNGIGIFSNSNHAFEITEGLTIKGNTFDQNGVSGSYLRHHIYTEGLNTTVDNNVFLKKIAGDVGSLLKMRDAGVTVTNNQFGSSPGHLIDLGDVQSDAMVAQGYHLSDAFYYDNLVEGNQFDASSGNIYLGGDSLGKEAVSSETYRKQVNLRQNVFNFQADRNQMWRLGILRAPSADQTFILESNDFNAGSLTTGTLATNFGLMADAGNLQVLNQNTMESTIAQWADNASGDGTITGWDNMVIDGGSEGGGSEGGGSEGGGSEGGGSEGGGSEGGGSEGGGSEGGGSEGGGSEDPTNEVHGTSAGDKIFGTASEDTIFSYAGDDILYGSDGDDTFFAGPGNDFVSGDAGSDTILTGDGNDYVDAGWGDDTVYGDDGDDRIGGGNGMDVLFGGTGADLLRGGDHSDALSGDDGNDRLEGGTGDDVLIGGDGMDILLGGAGADRFVMEVDSAMNQVDQIWDFSVNEGDRLDLNDLLNAYDPQTHELSDFVMTEVHNWNHALISVDVDGGGDSFQPVAMVGYAKSVPLSELLQPLDTGSAATDPWAPAPVAGGGADQGSFQFDDNMNLLPVLATLGGVQLFKLLQSTFHQAVHPDMPGNAAVDQSAPSVSDPAIRQWIDALADQLRNVLNS